jgi:hypothetical protein
MKGLSGGIATFDFKLENLGPFAAGSTKLTLSVPPCLSITSLPAGFKLTKKTKK